MKITKLENIVDKCTSVDCDLLIIYDCHEDRSLHISETIPITPKSVLILRHESNRDFSKVFSHSELHEVSTNANISGTLERLLADFGKEANISLDISCIPRTVMAEIFVTLTMLCTKDTLNLNTYYSLAEFTLPNSESMANESIEPVHQLLAGWSSPEAKPTSLILGLGYEPHRAAGASEYFEPSDQWIFIPRSPIYQFLEEVNRNNSDLISKSSSNRTIEYDLDNPEVVFGQLELVIGSLLKNSNPVLLPFGPKIFFFLCLVQCLNHPELGVWRVTGSDTNSSVNVKASGHIIGIACQFQT